MRRFTGRAVAGIVLSLAILYPTRPVAAPQSSDVVTLSIVGTTDLHGYVFPRGGAGGLALLGGYVNNLRASRAADGGAVLLIDSGDTYQGGIESNLSEGAIVIDAYNAMGYTAAVIGNHDFEFGPVDQNGARQPRLDDPRGALKARAAQARFPMLAANLVDEAANAPVAWPNVHPSALVEVAGVRVGIVGVMTIDALRATLPVNVGGLRVLPLAPAIAVEASRLRAAGAQVIVVGAHAGGGCAAFANSADLSSCDPSSEIFQLARALPPGLVDVIAAGHAHDGLAHLVEGIAIVEAYALGRAFSRVDLVFDRLRERVVHREVFAPREVCERQDPVTLDCESRSTVGAALPVARYEGRDVAPDPAIARAMAPALDRVRQLQATPLGVTLDTPIGRTGRVESALGNLFADALRESSTGADVAINNNSRGGLRADLPEGGLTFGRLYDAFPFDNRLVRLTLSGADLARVLGDEVRRNRRGALGISGVQVRTSCSAEGLRVELFRPSGRSIAAEESVVVVAMDSLASGVLFTSVARPEGEPIWTDAPVVREAVEEWLRRRGGRLHAAQFANDDLPRWDYAADAAACSTR